MEKMVHVSETVFSTHKYLVEPKCRPLTGSGEHDYLLSGEYYDLEVNDVIFVKHGFGIAHGTLTCTNYRLRFTSHLDKPFYQGKNYISIPLFSIDKVNKIGDLFSSLFFSMSEHGFSLDIECKDMNVFTFSFVPFSKSRGKIYDWLLKNIAPCKCVFAYRFSEPHCNTDNIYTKYDPIREYSRLGITQRCGPWRVSTVNADYELCPSYPAKLLVPTCVTDEMLLASAKFRTKGRIPVCSWRHPQTGAALCRSSQPMVGIVGNTCNNDQFLILSIQVASLDSHPDVSLPDPTESIANITQHGPPPLIIFDPRPRVNAMANTMAGAGFESSNTYVNCQVRFLGIANIHCIRESYNRMRDFCNSEIPKDIIPSALNATEWYSHLTTIFNGANKIADKLKKGISALIHCSDGWDRTTQLISLVQLMLDPYYRTLEGFIVLIEKEWLSFGHKFADRCRTTENKEIKLQERSPIFLQFLESTYHLLHTNQTEFQFNDRLLRKIVKHIHACKYGTFLFNCERERRELLEKRKVTTSFWLHILEKPEPYYNSKYRPSKDELLFDTSNIKAWPFFPCPKVKS